MKIHNLVITLFVGSLSILAYPISDTISGSISVEKDLKAKTGAGGVLFVFARLSGQSTGAPAAVLRVPNPKFPYEFSLGSQNAMIPGTPFTGPFTITAKFTTHGDVMQQKGTLIGKSKDGTKPGMKNVNIVIDTEQNASAGETKIKMH